MLNWILGYFAGAVVTSVWCAKYDEPPFLEAFLAGLIWPAVALMWAFELSCRAVEKVKKR